MTKILLDEGLPRRAAAELVQRGIDALHVTEIGLTATADEEILCWADAQGRIVVTLDADSHAILATVGASSPSVIRIRIEGLSPIQISTLLISVITRHGDSLREGSALTIRPGGIGKRRLPIGSDPEAD